MCLIWVPPSIDPYPQIADSVCSCYTPHTPKIRKPRTDFISLDLHPTLQKPENQEQNTEVIFCKYFTYLILSKRSNIRSKTEQKNNPG